MKELIKKASDLIELKHEEILSAAILHLFVLALGFVSSRAEIFSSLTPLGVAFAGAVPISFLPSASLGVFIGYFIPAIKYGAFRYIAAFLAVVAVRSLLVTYKKISSNPLFVCAVTILCMTLSAPLSVFKEGIFALIGEIVLCGALTYCIRISFLSVYSSRTGLLPQELACLLVSVAFLLSGIYRISAYGVTFSHIISTLIILFSATVGGVFAASLAGIATSFACLLSSGGVFEYSLFAFMGIVCGIFAIYGRLALCLSLVASALVGIAANRPTKNSVIFLIEMLIGAVIFLVLPTNFNTAIGKFLSFRPKISLQKDVKKLLKIKLLDLSKALNDVSNSTDEISKRLYKMHFKKPETVFKQVEEKVCDGCKLRIHCWETKKEQTEIAVHSVTNSLKSSNLTDTGVLPDEFRARCLNKEKFLNEAVKCYRDYFSKTSAENRIFEVREVINEQFSGMSLMLGSLANEIENGETYDRNAALCAAAVIKSFDIYPEELVCTTDKFGRMSVKIKAHTNRDTAINKMQIMFALTNALGRRFDVPTVTGKQDNLFISLFEAPKYKVSVGAHQITALGSSMCGDSYKYFPDGQGRFCIVLSDGMGTGGAAAVDSAMASDIISRLIKSGFDLSCALKILNSSMLFKSSEESLATLDIALVDTFSGKVQILKAGAAPTVVRRGGRTGEADCSSLPVGILREVTFEKSQVHLKSGDILLMMSDGATADGTDWIKRELENSGEIEADVLAENIALAAKRRRLDGHEDDITVIAAVIEKQV